MPTPGCPHWNDQTLGRNERIHVHDGGAAQIMASARVSKGALASSMAGQTHGQVNMEPPGLHSYASPGKVSTDEATSSHLAVVPHRLPGEGGRMIA